jgi:hypothetical protein
MKTFVLCLSMAILFGCSASFSKQDIANVEADMRKDFETKGFTVTKIQLTRQSKTKLSGVILLRKNVPGVGDLDFSRVCTVTMDQASSTPSWKCEDR